MSNWHKRQSAKVRELLYLLKHNNQVDGTLLLNSLVRPTQDILKWIAETTPTSTAEEHPHPYVEGAIYVFLGDTVQMPNHGTFVRISDGKIFVNWHTSSFEMIPPDEC